MWKFMHFNGQLWELIPISENTLLIQLKSWDVDPLPNVWKLDRVLQQAGWPWVLDLVPAYASLGITVDRLEINLNMLAERLQQLNTSDPGTLTFSADMHEVPVCYDLGLDWDEVERQTGLERDEYISRHSSGEYRLAMMGFLPGFIYLEGLDKRLVCRRKADPREKVPQGAVGIGGSQTGIYSFSCPGGWQIIGRTPLTLFDAEENPPMAIRPGDQLRFLPISHKEFEELRKDEKNQD
jgi:KipI family sensor histidine kinase inhibitor